MSLIATVSMSLMGFEAAPGWAQSFVPADQCALFVASRPDVQTAHWYIHDNGLETVARVFESSNGWFAIATGTIPNEGSTLAVSRMARAGSVPSDAYCSDGAPYVREVDWRADAADPSYVAGAGLWDEFDARPLERSEKRFLQAALAMAGYYHGLIDGVWGNGSQSALDRYTAAEFDGVKPTNAHAALLVGITFNRWADEGWTYRHVDDLDISVMLPAGELRLVEEYGMFEEWRHRSKDLTIHLNDLTTRFLRSLHGEIERAEDIIGEPYVLRDATTWITSARTRSGNFYVRSDLIFGTWSTIGITAGPSSAANVGLISSSIRTGPPVGILPPDGGVLAAFTSDLGAALSGPAEPNRRSPQSSAGLAKSEIPQEPEQPGITVSTGTAFYVTGQGTALTNAHVVESCTSLTLQGEPAEIISISTAFDLAAIRLTIPQETPFLSFSPNDAALNADITIAGFPLHGILGGLNVGRGSVSALKGLQGDETSVQISAPVQPGNSGGPAIDHNGGIVGVVVSKLDAIALADATGDIAQNVNFAIRGSLAKVFLASNGIDYSEVEADDVIAPEAAAEILQEATGLVECSE